MALPAPAPAPRRSSGPRTLPRPFLRVIRPPGRQRARVPFFALCLAILVAAMLGALVLNTSMAANAYDIHTTKIDLARTVQNNQELHAEVEKLAAPSRLAERAAELGMVPGEGINYINLSAGTVIGPAATAKD